MIPVKSTITELESRGYVDKNLILSNSKIDKISLRKQLASGIPTQRTTAAILIRKNNILELLPDLIEALKSESKLYCKIAIAETLIGFKDNTTKMIIPYLGIIGKNQHYKLPLKPFKKDSYPLPRDIVARILVNIGISVIPDLINNFKTFTHIQILETIDVLGHISFYTKDKNCLPLLLKLYAENEDDSIIRWKLLRSFSAFDNEAVKSILKKVMKESKIQSYIWEAERSLRLIKKRKCSYK